MSQQKKNIFIDASLNSQPWFDDLLIEYQMAYGIHIWIDSNNIGVWKPHFRELNFKLKRERDPIDPDDFLRQVNSDSKHIEVLDSGDWWLIDYLPLQVRTLTPNNRPHVSYIEDLRDHGLLTRYAQENPGHVKFDIIYDLEKWESIEDFDQKKKYKAAWKYLDSKGLIRPLREACETLARGWQGSKEKEEEEDTDKEEEENQDQSPILSSSVQPKKKMNGKPTLNNGYYSELKSHINELALTNTGSLTFQRDVDSLIEEFKTDQVKDPKNYLMQEVKRIDWLKFSWPDFVRGIKQQSEMPF